MLSHPSKKMAANISLRDGQVTEQSDQGLAFLIISRMHMHEHLGLLVDCLPQKIFINVLGFYVLVLYAVTLLNS